jgi:hypothetical protein
MFSKITGRSASDPVPFLEVQEIIDRLDRATLRAVQDENASREAARAAWDAATIEVAGVEMVPGAFYNVSFREYRDVRRVLSVRYESRHPVYGDFEKYELAFARPSGAFWRRWLVNVSRVEAVERLETVSKAAQASIDREAARASRS